MALALGASGLACAEPSEQSADESSPPSSDELKQIPPTGLSKDQLKAEVRRIALENTLKTDDASLAAARKQLNPLIADLARIYGTPPASVELDNGFAGTWKQLFSDDFRAAPPGAPVADQASIHQVVTKNGYFYNFSNQVLPTPPSAPSVVLTVFLRGEYTAAPLAHGLDIKFTRLGTLPSALPASEQIGALAANIESGAIGAAAPGNAPGAGPTSGTGGPPPGARGPVGVKGKLQNLYLDADLRVSLGGTQDQLFNKVYVLERVPPTGK
jgi:hypothetical protein